MNGRIDGSRHTVTISCELTVGASRASAHRGDGGSVLPSPLPLDANGTASAIGALYLLVAKRRDSQSAGAKVQIEASEKQAHAHLEQQMDALAREAAHREDSGEGLFASLGKIVGDLVDDVVHVQIGDAFEHLGENGEAMMDSPKFWAELEDGAILVGKIAAVAASAAGTVASFGAAGPVMVAVIIGVSLSAASMVQDEAHLLERLGVDKDVAAWASVGCAVAGAIVTAGAGTATTAASQAAQASQFSKGMRGAALGMGALSAESKVAAGGAHIERGRHAEIAENAVADRQAAIFASARMHRQVDALIEAFAESDKSASRTLESLQGVVHTHGQSLVLSTARV